MPRKPQSLSGRAARCAPHPAPSLPSVARSPGLRCLRRRASRSATAPFSPTPEWWPGVARGGCWAVAARCGGAREKRVRGRAGRAERCVAVPARPAGGWGGLRDCGWWAVAVRMPLRSRSWRSETATAGRAEGESLSRSLSTAGGAESRGYVAQRPRAAEGFLGVCVAVKSKSVSPVQTHALRVAEGFRGVCRAVKNKTESPDQSHVYRAVKLSFCARIHTDPNGADHEWTERRFSRPVEHPV